MKFAFLIMDNRFCAETDRAEIHAGAAKIIGVATLSEACEAAKSLRAEGVQCIELCGAFGPEGAEAVIAACGGEIPVGYVTHLPEQDALYLKTFGH